MKNDLREIATELYKLGAIKFEKCNLASGLQSPIFVDLKVIFHSPELVSQISKALWEIVKDTSKYTHLCAVPDTAAWTIAAVMSQQTNLFMLMRRKPDEIFGMQGKINGIFNTGDKPIILDDVLTNGSSLLETVADLKKEGLDATTALVIVDREQGAVENLKRNGIKVKSLFKVTELANILYEAGKLDQTSCNFVLEYQRCLPTSVLKEGMPGTEMQDNLRKIAIELYEIGAIKFGKFTLKSGLESPIYVDLRVVMGFPDLMVRIAKTLAERLKSLSGFTHLCGVPYTGLLFAPLILGFTKIPMLMKRKEGVKSYGTKQTIEGPYNAGDKPIIVEDIITSGSSILETVAELKKEGLDVTTALVIINREQGAIENLAKNGIKVECLFKLTEYINILYDAGKLDKKDKDSVKAYLEGITAPVSKKVDTRLSLNFDERAAKAKSPMAKKLFNLMSSKQTTLCLAADLSTSEEILKVAEWAGDDIAVLKLHVDMVKDFNQTFIDKLKDVSRRKNFMIMEDKKFADIGNTASQQFRDSVFKYPDWADFITVHTIAGTKIIPSLEQELKECGIFVVAEMSSEGALTVGDYVKNTLRMSKESESLAGFVCQNNIFSDPGLIQLTPGVRLTKSTDDKGQQYNTPEYVVNSGADLVVVGRGILTSDDPVSSLMEYKKVLWEVYEKRTTANS